MEDCRCLSRRAGPQVREYVLFGRDHGGEPLKWLLLKDTGCTALLLSEHVLGAHHFSEGAADECCCWDDSYLKEWVADELLLDTFGSDEASLVEGFRILSAKEVARFFPRDEDRVAYPAANAGVGDMRLRLGAPCPYWTSTPGKWPEHMAFVRADGRIDTKGHPVFASVGLGVRLALEVKSEHLAHTWKDFSEKTAGPPTC